MFDCHMVQVLDDATLNMLPNLRDFLSFNTIFHFCFGIHRKVETSGIGMILFD